MIKTVKIHDFGFLVNGELNVPADEQNTDFQLMLDWINEGNMPEGPDIIEPDYIELRTGEEGYAPVGEQLGMLHDGSWKDHIKAVKQKFPKTIKGGVTIGDVPQELLDAAADKLAGKKSIA